MLEPVWEEQISTWQSFLHPDASFQIVPYSRLARAVLTRRDDGKVIRTTQPRLDRSIGRFEYVIADEAHYLKGRKANWAKAFTQLAKLTPRIALLTGTPIPNWAHELFMLLRYLYPGDPRFSAFWTWVHRWFQVGVNRWSGQHSLILGLHEHLTWEQFADEHFLDGPHVRYIRRLRGDVLDLPPLTEQRIYTPMTPGQRRVYREMQKALEATLPSGHELVTWTKGSQWPMLHALATGTEVLEPENDPRRRVPRDSTKLAMLLELCAERTTSPTLLFCAWRRSTEKVAHWLSTLAPTSYVHGGLTMTTRRRAIADFQEGRTVFLVGTYGTLSEGFTFNRADTCIRVERHPRPSSNEQAMRRIHRAGQTKPVLVIDLITPGSVDTRLVEQNEGKTDQQAGLLRAMDLLG